MKITPKILSIPPYISTSWNQIRTLYMNKSDLVICLIDNTSISIPNLNDQEITKIFNAHSTFTEQEQISELFSKNSREQNIEEITSMHINLENMESFSSAMNHNSEQAHMPNLPKEILKKIAGITKIIAPGEIQNMPKPEPHCNCPHCQIARAIHENADEATEDNQDNPPLLPSEEEVINDKDLSFQQWEITQLDQHLYSVSNRLDQSEKYNVFLGESIGCTCGQAGCEHILAVLKS